MFRPKSGSPGSKLDRAGECLGLRPKGLSFGFIRKTTREVYCQEQGLQAPLMLKELRSAQVPHTAKNSLRRPWRDAALAQP